VATCPMRLFLLVHHHLPEHCSSAWAAWKGHRSPLRGVDAACTCIHGGHMILWEVRAASASDALALLPDYVARSTRAITIRRVVTP
jgi:hypothetical protein